MSNYLLHHKEKKRGLFTKVFVIVSAIIAIFIILHIFFPNLLSSPAQFAGSIFWKTKNFSIERLTNSLRLLRSKKSLISENEKLKAEIKKAKFKSLEANFLKQENESLKNLLGREDIVKESVLGAILARPNISLYDTFVIDIGENFGIKIGDEVYVDGYIFVGKIDKVYKNTSLIKLFSSPGQITPVFIGPQNIFANAKGVGGGNFTIKLPRDIEIERGDIVTIQGINTKIFGIIEEIEANPSNPFITVFFKNPVNINNVKWVQVVKNKK